MTKVAIGICTYKRARELSTLLEHLNTIRGERQDIEIIVVDNDPQGTARDVVQPLKGVTYVLETSVGVSQARNTAVQEARKKNAEFLAFIDDDEIPDPAWLDELLRTQEVYGADVVAGPVLVRLPEEARQYESLLARKRFPTGTPRPYWGAGNVLISMKVFDEVGLFSTAYSRTGGEDTQFSARCAARGLKMVWCDEARAYEDYPQERAQLDWILRRNYSTGRIITRVEEELGMGRSPVRLANALVRLVAGTLALTVIGVFLPVIPERYVAKIKVFHYRGLGILHQWVHSAVAARQAAFQ